MSAVTELRELQEQRNTLTETLLQEGKEIQMKYNDKAKLIKGEFDMQSNLLKYVAPIPVTIQLDLSKTHHRRIMDKVSQMLDLAEMEAALAPLQGNAAENVLAVGK